MKKVLTVVAVIVLASALGAQSLVELAKREKERRESLQGRHAVVAKHTDLMRVRKVDAVRVTDPDAAAAEAAAGEAQDIEPESVSAEAEPVNPPSGSGAPSGRRIVPRVAPDGPSITGESDRDQGDGRGTLEAQLKAAKDLVDLLTTKMNALRQQYEFQDAMVPGYVIQQQLDETAQRLAKAEAQQARIEAQLEKKAGGKR